MNNYNGYSKISIPREVCIQKLMNNFEYYDEL